MTLGIVDALGGGMSEPAIRIAVFDGDRAAGDFDRLDSFAHPVQLDDLNSLEGHFNLTQGIDGGLTDLDTLLVDTPGNDAPIARDDVISVRSSRAVYGAGVLRNDADPDVGDTLTIIGLDATGTRRHQARCVELGLDGIDLMGTEFDVVLFDAQFVDNGLEDRFPGDLLFG